MPRHPRIDLPHVPQHVVQRGNDRRPCFFQPVDHIRYLDALRDVARRLGCAIHADVLMTNHVHLRLTPSGSAQVGTLMQAPGRRYVRYVNDRYHRTGTLWEGRYKACPVDSESGVLRCYRCIELNPVRAAMVTTPADDHGSSHRANAHGAHDRFPQPHPAYLALGPDGPARQNADRALVADAVTPEDIELIRLRLQRQHALGSDRFRAAIEAQLARRAGPARIGRPRKDRGVPAVRGKVHSDPVFPFFALFFSTPTPASGVGSARPGRRLEAPQVPRTGRVRYTA